MINIYRNAENVRFSCAYLFRIRVNGKYLLVRDEQGRGTFQPVGGVYKYFDSSFLTDTHAAQCTRFADDGDLDCDLRVIVPRKYVRKFYNWYNSEQGRETPENLYREFEEEILDRIGFIDRSVFKTIKYRFCGSLIEDSRMGRKDMQIHIADVVELIPTSQQLAAFLSMLEKESNVYRFATADEIYNLGRTQNNQVQSISPHTTKILEEDAHRLKHTKRTGKIFECQAPSVTDTVGPEAWIDIEKADVTKPFTFISYNSTRGSLVWNFCKENMPPLSNLWIDRKLVGENWQKDVDDALASPMCKKAILFINIDYLIRSSPCYHEASLIVKNKIPHVVVLLGIREQSIVKILKEWESTYADGPDMEKVRVFKELFHFNEENGHIECSYFTLEENSIPRLFAAYENL